MPYLVMSEEIYKKRWDYIKADPEGARALLILLKEGKGTLDDFDTMVDRIIESRQVGGGKAIESNKPDPSVSQGEVKP